LKLKGPLTQEVEYLPFKQRVVGSSPARPTKKELWKKAVNLWKRKVGCFSLLLMDLWPTTLKRSITFSVSKSSTPCGEALAQEDYLLFL
jgi:hypothetical protein